MTLTNVAITVLSVALVVLAVAYVRLDKKIDHAIHNLSYGIDATARNLFDTLHHKIESLKTPSKATLAVKNAARPVAKKTATKKVEDKKVAKKTVKKA